MSMSGCILWLVVLFNLGTCSLNICILVFPSGLPPVPNIVTLLKAWFQWVLVDSYAEGDIHLSAKHFTKIQAIAHQLTVAVALEMSHMSHPDCRRLPQFTTTFRCWHYHNTPLWCCPQPDVWEASVLFYIIPNLVYFNGSLWSSLSFLYCMN